MKSPRHHRWLPVMSLCISVISLGMVAVSFSTTNWLVFVVPSTASTTNSTGSAAHPELFHTRYRGLFKTCYIPTDPNMTWITSVPYSSLVVDGTCLVEQGYHLTNADDAFLAYGNDYKSRTHLLRSHWAVFVVAIVTLVIACTVSAASIYNQRRDVTSVASGLLFLAAFCIGVGMAFFHGCKYLEDGVISVNLPVLPFYAYTSQSVDYIAILQTPGRGDYGYSYALGWVGMIAAGLSALMMMSSSHWLNKAAPTLNTQPQTNQPPPPGPGFEVPLNARNRAYYYAERINTKPSRNAAMATDAGSMYGGSAVPSANSWYQPSNVAVNAARPLGNYTGNIYADHHQPRGVYVARTTATNSPPQPHLANVPEQQRVFSGPSNASIVRVPWVPSTPTGWYSGYTSNVPVNPYVGRGHTNGSGAASTMSSATTPFEQRYVVQKP